MTAMTSRYPYSASLPRLKLPVAAHAARGTIITMQAMTNAVLKKVTIWR